MFTLTSFSEHIDPENLSGMAALVYAGKLGVLNSWPKFENVVILLESSVLRKNHDHALIPTGHFLGLHLTIIFIIDYFCF